MDFLDYSFGISFISEIELLGHQKNSVEDEIKLKLLIGDCFYIDWNQRLKEETILFRKKYSIKLPDSIIAATLKLYQIPLITADKGFSKIQEIDLLLLEI